jgi:hypothetical protein
MVGTLRTVGRDREHEVRAEVASSDGAAGTRWRARIRLPLCMLGSLALLASGCGRPALQEARGQTPTQLPRPVEPLPPNLSATRSLPLCMPAAPRFEINALLNPAPAKAACELVTHQQQNMQTGKLSWSTTYTKQGDWVVGKRTDAGGSYLALRYQRDSAGRVVVFERYTKHVPTTPAQRIERSFDAAGRLLSERTTTKSYRHEILQRFDGSRQLSRDEYRDGALHTHYSWRYDQAGRLVEALRSNHAQTSKEKTARALWRYDAQGRPTRVERFYAGETISLQTWRWRGEAVKGALLAERSATLMSGSAYYWLPLDNHQAQGPWEHYYGVYGKPWFADRPGADGSCQPLPVAFGLPSGDDYALVWRDRDQAAAVKLALERHRKQGPYSYSEELRHLVAGVGYEAYGVSYYYYTPALPLTYGHFGAAGPWGTHLSRAGSAPITMAVRYDEQGRLLSQRVTTAVRVEGKDVEVTHSRERSFGAAGLERDDASFYAGAPELAFTRSLRFTHDGRGNLTRRELRHGETLLEWQSWDYDGKDRPLAHRVALQTSAGRGFVRWPSKQSERKLEAPSLRAEITRSYAGDAVAAESERWDEHGERTLAFSTTAEGLIEARSERRHVQAPNKPQNGQKRVERLDASGRLVYTERRALDDKWHYSRESRYDAAGQLRSVETKSQSSHVVTRTDYSCGE